MIDGNDVLRDLLAKNITNFNLGRVWKANFYVFGKIKIINAFKRRV